MHSLSCVVPGSNLAVQAMVLRANPMGLLGTAYDFHRHLVLQPCFQILQEFKCVRFSFEDEFLRNATNKCQTPEFLRVAVNVKLAVYERAARTPNHYKDARNLIKAFLKNSWKLRFLLQRLHGQ